jgi:hypothetical protein
VKRAISKSITIIKNVKDNVHQNKRLQKVNEAIQKLLKDKDKINFNSVSRSWRTKIKGSERN